MTMNRKKKKNKRLTILQDINKSKDNLTNNNYIVKCKIAKI